MSEHNKRQESEGSSATKARGAEEWRWEDSGVCDYRIYAGKTYIGRAATPESASLIVAAHNSATAAANVAGTSATSGKWDCPNNARVAVYGLALGVAPMSDTAKELVAILNREIAAELVEVLKAVHGLNSATAAKDEVCPDCDNTGWHRLFVKDQSVKLKCGCPATAAKDEHSSLRSETQAARKEIRKGLQKLLDECDESQRLTADDFNIVINAR